MKIVIPVAGEGTRLRPHTYTMPKSLLHVAGKPILGHVLDQIEGLDFSEVVFVIGLYGEKIKDYVDKHYRFKCRFIEQKDSYGLGYAVHLGVYEDTEEVLIILGDTIVDLDWQGLISGNVNRIVVKEVEDPRSFGVVETKGDNIIRLEEKPEQPKSNLAVVGVYFIQNTEDFKNCLNEVVERRITDQGEIQLTGAFKLALEKGLQLHAYPTAGWYDCGKRETILATNRHLLDKDSMTTERKGSIIVSPSFVAPSAKVENSIIGPYVSIGGESVVRNSIIKDSIVSMSAHVEDSILEGSLIGNKAIVKGSAACYNIGDSSEVGNL